MHRLQFRDRIKAGDKGCVGNACAVKIGDVDSQSFPDFNFVCDDDA
ncbi:MAG: hypothetical protein Q4A06_06630 [Cardiobacteriaceae bacterium]|nr:hypothetical protein [Cardiobacteriaceae bacterium]